VLDGTGTLTVRENVETSTLDALDVVDLDQSVGRPAGSSTVER
jgi:hypothetical protein